MGLGFLCNLAHLTYSTQPQIRVTPNVKARCVGPPQFLQGVESLAYEIMIGTMKGTIKHIILVPLKVLHLWVEVFFVWLWELHAGFRVWR